MITMHAAICRQRRPTSLLPTTCAIIQRILPQNEVCQEMPYFRKPPNEPQLIKALTKLKIP